MPTPSVTSYLFHLKLINLIISSIWHYSSWIHTESHKHITSPSCRWPSRVAFLPHEILTIFLGPLPLENPFKMTFNLWMGTSNNPLFLVPMRNTENSVSKVQTAPETWTCVIDWEDLNGRQSWDVHSENEVHEPFGWQTDPLTPSTIFTLISCVFQMNVTFFCCCCF